MIPKCDCKGVYLYNELVLPKSDLAEGIARPKKTLVTKDDTCKFCGSYVTWHKPRKKYKRKA